MAGRGCWKKSEGRSVMEWIGTATLFRRANGQTSSESFVTRKQAELVQEEMANERGASHVCVLRQGNTREPSSTGPSVRVRSAGCKSISSRLGGIFPR